MPEKTLRVKMIKSIRNLKSRIGGKSEEEKDNDYDGGAGDLEFVPALLGEIKSFAVTPFGTYGIGNNRLLRGVILFGTASPIPEGKHKKRFMLDDMTGKMVVEVEIEEMPIIPSTVLVIGTLERRNGINNVKAKYVKKIPLNETILAGAWHTLKAIESINMDVKSASKAAELLKEHSFLTLIRRSRLSSNQLSLRHVIFAVDAQMVLSQKDKEQRIPVEN
jgi:hypothetical protein